MDEVDVIVGVVILQQQIFFVCFLARHKQGYMSNPFTCALAQRKHKHMHTFSNSSGDGANPMSSGLGSLARISSEGISPDFLASSSALMVESSTRTEGTNSGTATVSNTFLMKSCPAGLSKRNPAGMAMRVTPPRSKQSGEECDSQKETQIQVQIQKQRQSHTQWTQEKTETATHTFCCEGKKCTSEGFQQTNTETNARMLWILAFRAAAQATYCMCNLFEGSKRWG